MSKNRIKNRYDFKCQPRRSSPSSFGNSVKSIKYQWDTYRTPYAVYVDPGNNNDHYLGFQYLPPVALDEVCQYGKDIFSCPKVVVSLKRKFHVYILQIYVPATLLVVLSWITFWINIKSTPARASLSVTTVLSILTLATQTIDARVGISNSFQCFQCPLKFISVIF